MKYGILMAFALTALFSFNGFSKVEEFKVCKKLEGNCPEKFPETMSGKFFKTKIDFLGPIERNKDLQVWIKENSNIEDLARLNSTNLNSKLARHTALKFCKSQGFTMLESATWFMKQVTGVHCSNEMDPGKLRSRIRKSTAIVCAQFLSNPRGQLEGRPDGTCSKAMKKHAMATFKIDLEADTVITSIPSPGADNPAGTGDGAGTK